MLPKFVKRARVLTWGYNANITSFAGRTTSSDRILQHAYTLIANLSADREVRSPSLCEEELEHLANLIRWRTQTTDLSYFYVIRLVGL